jgi:hypothetical protein
MPPTPPSQMQELHGCPRLQASGHGCMMPGALTLDREADSEVPWGPGSVDLERDFWLILKQVVLGPMD